MRALVLRQHGGLQDLDVVEDYPTPKAKEGHVVIRVRASSFNYHDIFTVRGMPGIKVPLPVIIGLDMAGEVVEVGPGVTKWKPGDRVLANPLNKAKGLMGEMLDGGMAEYCLISADQLIAMPEHVTFEEAAALPVAYGTAHRMLITHNTVKKGDRVLILGASGGVLETDAVRHGDQLVGGDQAIFGHAAVEHLAHQALFLVERIDQHAVARLPAGDA